MATATETKPMAKVEKMHQTLCSLVEQSNQLHQTTLDTLHQFYHDFCCGPSEPSEGER